MAVNYRRGIRRLYVIYLAVVCALSVWLAMKGAWDREFSSFQWCVERGRPNAECHALFGGSRATAWEEAGIWIALWGFVLPLIAYGLFRLVRWLVAGFKPPA